MSNLLTVTEAADALRLKVSTLYRWAYARRIPTVRIGNRLRFERGVIETLIRQGRRPALHPLHTLEDPGDGEGGER